MGLGIVVGIEGLVRLLDLLDTKDMRLTKAYTPTALPTSNSEPKEDFGGGHPDPNLTYAHDLVKAMGLGITNITNRPTKPDRPNLRHNASYERLQMFF